jgi:hypothetical protein
LSLPFGFISFPLCGALRFGCADCAAARRQKAESPCC